MVRTADWFGVTQILLSDDCADITNPKCIMATMGSFTRVRWFEGITEEILRTSPAPVYGCLLSGTDLRSIKPQKPCYLVIGSESQGIRSEMLRHISHPLTIAREGGAESLNAAMAAGIALYEFSRA
jgi:RNA methyltransferase, TrmH family